MACTTTEPANHGTPRQSAPQPGLQTEVAVPDHALEKRVDERHDQRRRTQLRNESRTLGNPPEMIAGIAAKVSRRKTSPAVTVIGADHRRRLHEVTP
jgi:hypothetical protein